MAKENDESDSLGSCGCVDYHMADCPLRTAQYDYINRQQQWEEDFYERED